jgi:folylpolyglutamate synthase/dihydropteroate synthase
MLVAHTPESIEVLCQNWDDIKPYRSSGRVLFVIAMSKDKDHRQCLAKLHSEKRDRMQTPIFTEVPIAGSFKRTAPAQVLRDCWIDLTKGESKKVASRLLDGDCKL